MTVEIRRATLDDVASLVALNDHVHGLHVAAAPWRYRPTVAEDVAAHYAKQLTDGVDLRIASVDGEDLGYVVLFVRDDAGGAFTRPGRFVLVDQLAVRDDARGQGIGRALMDEATAVARASACERVVLDVIAENEGAIAFYERLGFAPVSRRLHRFL